MHYLNNYRLMLRIFGQIEVQSLMYTLKIFLLSLLMILLLAKLHINTQ